MISVSFEVLFVAWAHKTNYTNYQDVKQRLKSMFLTPWFNDTLLLGATITTSP